MTAEITSMPTDEDLRALTYVSQSLIQGAGDGIFKVRGSGDWPQNIVISTYGPIVSMLLADVPDDRKDYCVAAHHEQVIFDHPDATRDQEWVWIPARAMASYNRRTTPHTAFFANTELNSEALEVASHVDAELVGFFPRGRRGEWTIALQVKYGITSRRDGTEIMTSYGTGFCREMIETALAARAAAAAAAAVAAAAAASMAAAPAAAAAAPAAVAAPAAAPAAAAAQMAHEDLSEVDENAD